MLEYKNLTENNLDDMNVSRVKRAIEEFERLERNFIERMRGEFTYSEESWEGFFVDGDAILKELVSACHNLVNAVDC